MVTAANLNTSKNGTTTKLMSHDETTKEYEKEGFYSTCGQAFIRVSPKERR